jgi:alpha-galactosidase
MRAIVLLASACLLVATTRALNNSAGLVPPLGWSTWCADGPCELDYCSEPEVKAAAEALIANGMYDAGYRWILLDDCWAAGARTANDSITWDTDRFPSGIPALTQWLHTRNLQFGLYTSAGNTTCSSGGRRYPILGSEGHYQQDMNSFAAWNVDYVKVDWCGDVHKLPLDGLFVGAKDYIAISAAITNTTPARTMYLEGVAAGLFLGADVKTYMNGWRASTDHHDKWTNTLEVVATVQLVGIQGEPGAWSDMDVLMTGGQGCRQVRPYSNNDTTHCPGMTDDEYITEFSLWNIMQSPLIVSTDIRNMTAIMNRVLLNKRFLDIHQDTQTPPGKYLGGDDTCAYDFLPGIACQLWTRPLADGSVLAVLFNAQLDASSAAVSITVDFTKWGKKLGGWTNSTAVVVEDLWSNATKTTVTGQYVSPPIKPHGVNVVVLHPTGTQQP